MFDTFKKLSQNIAELEHVGLFSTADAILALRDDELVTVRPERTGVFTVPMDRLLTSEDGGLTLFVENGLVLTIPTGVTLTAHVQLVGGTSTAVYSLTASAGVTLNGTEASTVVAPTGFVRAVLVQRGPNNFVLTT